jgi:uncharacterized membrane protein
MGTARGFDRLVFFTDAVTAIAITLLILPLVDLVPGYAAHHGATVGGFLHDYWTPIWSFALSFVIIARLWMANHSVLEPVERQSTRLVVLDVGWAFTVVLLPLPTALIATLTPERTGIALYIGTMTASSLLLTAICWEVYRHPELGGADRQRTLVSLYGVGSNAAGFVLALIIGVVFPQINYFALLILLLTIPLDWIIKPRLRPATAHLAEPAHTTSGPAAG